MLPYGGIVWLDMPPYGGTITDDEMIDDEDIKRIKKIKSLIKKKLYDYETPGLKVIKYGGFGRGRFSNCYWIDVKYGENDVYAASILFYEDSIIDSKTGNLHPGRDGYVVFQKWHNIPFERKAPNIRMRVGKCYGVFIPIEKEYRKETGINVLDKSNTAEKIAEEIFSSFIMFTSNFS